MRAHGRWPALVAHVEDRARREDCVQLDLGSTDRREDAHAVYRRLAVHRCLAPFVKDLMPDAASGPPARP